MSIPIDVFGFGIHEWTSVERTRQFYEKALAGFELRRRNDFAEQPPLPALALNFAAMAGWKFTQHPPYPIAYGMHGGAILDHAFLLEHLPRLQTTDVLIVNCKSDIQILNSYFSGRSPTIGYLPLPVDS